MQKERHENQVAQLKLLVWPREMGDQLEQLDIPLSLSRQVLSSRLCTRGVCSQGVFALGAQTKIFGKYAPLQITRLSVLIQIVALRALFIALYTSLKVWNFTPTPSGPGPSHPTKPYCWIQTWCALRSEGGSSSSMISVRTGARSRKKATGFWVTALSHFILSPDSWPIIKMLNKHHWSHKY